MGVDATRFTAAGACGALGRGALAPFATAGLDPEMGFLAAAAFGAVFDFVAGFARAAGFAGRALAAALGLALGFALATPLTLEITAASSFLTVPSALPRFAAGFATGFFAFAAGLDAVFFFAAGLPLAAAFAGFAAAPRLFVLAPFAMLLDILYRRFGRFFSRPPAPVVAERPRVIA